MYINKRLPVKQAAFTLLELIVVVILVAILSSYTFTRFSTSNRYKQNTVVELLISSGQLAQQLSMNDSSRNFSLSIQTNQINLIENGSSFSVGDLDFPLSIDSAISLSPITTIVYDGLGTTTTTTITVAADTNINVCFDASGFIHQC